MARYNSNASQVSGRPLASPAPGLILQQAHMKGSGMMQQTILITLSLLILTSAGCNDLTSNVPLSDQTDASFPPLRLTQIDFDSVLPARNFTSQNELVQELRNSGIFLKSDDAGEQDQGDESAYLKCILALYEPFKIYAVGEHLELHTKIDGSACMPLSPDFKTGTYVHQSSLYLSCPGGNFSDLNGKDYTSLPDDQTVRERCANAPHILQKSYQKTALSAVIEAGQPDGSIKTYESDIVRIEAHATHDMKPCRTTNIGGSWTVASDCRTRIKETTVKMLEDGAPVTPLHGTEVIVSAVANDLILAAQQSSNLFQSGQFDVTINDWKGFVAYKDASQPPVYQLRKDNKEWSDVLE